MEESLGIDEAGRGPVFGPLVVGMVAGDLSEVPAGIRLEDSKKLSPAQREKSAHFIRESCVWQVHYIPAAVISFSELPLQHLEARVISAALANFALHIPVYVDALGSGRAAENWVRLAHPERKIRFEKKADERYKIVSAASILAKLARDRVIEKLKKRWGEIGSGYPSDPKTQDWLELRAQESEVDWPAFVRLNWKTIRRFENSE